MKFFIPISNSFSANLVYCDDVLLKLLHLLYYRYFKHHSLLPKNDLYLKKGVPQYGYGYYLKHLSIFEYFPYYKFGLLNHDNVSEYLLLKHGNDIWLPKQYVLLIGLLYVNLFHNSYRKNKKFTEIKVAAIRLQNANLIIENKYIFN